MRPGLREVLLQRQMKISAMKVVKLPVSLEGPIVVSQEPKPCSAQQAGFFLEFTARGVDHLLASFDCASGHLNRNFWKIWFIENQKTARRGAVDKGFLKQTVPSMSISLCESRTEAIPPGPGKRP